MAMATDELNANITVQNLKPQVNRANSLTAEQLPGITGTELGLLVGAVSTSIAKRTNLRSMGADPGHMKRIEIEHEILAKLNVEVQRRDKISSDAQRARQAAALSQMPNVLANSNWARKA